MRLLPLLMLLGCGDKDPDDADGDGFPSYEDCDDTRADVYPGAPELCDGWDNDCNNVVDEDATERFYYDGDGDGFGDAARSADACTPPTDYVAQADDCDDSASEINPDATESCDGVDNNCNGGVDEGVTLTFYADTDGDGFGDPLVPVQACAQEDGLSENDLDCDDAQASVNPDGQEVCGGGDEDCDGLEDDADDSLDTSTARSWFPDADGDGFGDQAGEVLACEAPQGSLLNSGDCDDGDAEVFPGAVEVCDGVDNDCDSRSSEDGMVWWTGDDGSQADMTTNYAAGTASNPWAHSLRSPGTLTFCAGEYHVLITAAADISLVGLHGAGSTTLSGGGQGSVLTVEQDGLAVQLQGLTVSDGVGDLFLSGIYDGGGGLACAANSTVNIDACVFSDNDGEMGGAVAMTNCTVAFTDSTLSGNTADFGGAIAMFDGGSLSLVDSLVTGNTADYGGGAYIRSNGAPAMSCAGTSSGSAGFESNTGSISGGAVRIWGGTLSSSVCDWGTRSSNNSPDDISNSRFTSNYGSNASFSCTQSGCN